MRAARRLREERGYSLIEMVTVLAILSVILTSLTTLFVQGTHAEMDMRERFEAQQDARIALDKLRREIHCAASAQTVGVVRVLLRSTMMSQSLYVADVSVASTSTGTSTRTFASSVVDCVW